MMMALLDIARRDDHQTEKLKSKPFKVDNGYWYSKSIYIYIYESTDTILTYKQITNLWNLNYQDKDLKSLKGKV